AGDVGRAAGFLRSAVQYAPGNAIFRCNLAEACRRLGRLDEARTELEATLARDPELVEGDYNLAVLREDLGDPLAPPRAFEAALGRRPTLLVAAIRLLTTLRESGNAERAIEEYARRSRTLPESAELHREVASAYAQCHRFDEGARHFERALELEPS